MRNNRVLSCVTGRALLYTKKFPVSFFVFLFTFSLYKKKYLAWKGDWDE